MMHLLSILFLVFLASFGCDDRVDYTPKPTLCTGGDCEATTGPSTSECRDDEDCSDGFICVVADDSQGAFVCVRDAVCVDKDGDGYGRDCDLGSDCDDDDYFRNPSVVEICNTIDDNCDGRIDEESVCVGECVSECEISTQECVGEKSERQCVDNGQGCGVWLPPRTCPGESICLDDTCTQDCIDLDQDGYGTNCDLGDDCDDRNPLVYPGNPEVCDGYDNDCNNAVDDQRVCDPTCNDACEPGQRRCTSDFRRVLTCERNADGCYVFVSSLTCEVSEVCLSGQCETPTSCEDFDQDGYGFNCPFGPDCDDNNPTIPSPVEVCDGVDNNCSGLIDDIPGTNCSAAACSEISSFDTIDSARVLASSEVGSSILCANRADVWDLGVIEGQQRILISTFVPHTSTNTMRVQLLRSVNGQIEVRETFEGGDIVAEDFIADRGRHYLRVEYASGVPGGSNGTYSIAWQIQSLNSCVEEPVNGTPTQPQTISADHLYPVEICGTDLDFFRVTDLNVGDVISVEMNYGSSLGEVLVDFWRDGTIISPDQRVRSGHRHAHTRVVQGTSAVIGVRPFNAATSPRRSYTLSVKKLPSSLGCLDTDLEIEGARSENDSIFSAQPMPSSGRVAGRLCPGDIDVFFVGNYPAGAQFSARLTFDPVQNLDAYLFRGDMTDLLQNALTENMPEILPTRIPNAGDYYVVIIGRDALQTSDYTFEVE